VLFENGKADIFTVIDARERIRRILSVKVGQVAAFHCRRGELPSVGAATCGLPREQRVPASRQKRLVRHTKVTLLFLRLRPIVLFLHVTSNAGVHVPS
jgi:hypothetical protein